MGIFSRKNETIPVTTKLELITQTNGQTFLWNGKIYDSDIVRACIRPTVKAIGKLIPKHVRETVNTDGISDKKINPDAYMKILLMDPNPIMTMQQMLEKITWHYKINHNAFVLIVRDENEYPIQLLPLNPSNAQVKKDDAGNLFYSFQIGINNHNFRFNDIIHLKGDYSNSQYFGDNPSKSLTQLMEVIGNTDISVINAIKNSAIIKWLLKYSTPLRPEDLKKNAKDFSDMFLNSEQNGAGVAAIDSKADAIQIQNNDYVPNALIVDKNYSRIKSFFNTNDKIITSSYSEEEWNAYYEGEVEPIAVQLSQEFTRKLFNRRERAFGNSILFESSELAFASLQTKLALVAMVDRKAMTPNEWRKYLGLAPIEGGDVAVHWQEGKGGN